MTAAQTTATASGTPSGATSHDASYTCDREHGHGHGLEREAVGGERQQLARGAPRAQRPPRVMERQREGERRHHRLEHPGRQAAYLRVISAIPWPRRPSPS